VVICGLLIIVIMLQSGEAADLAGAFGGAENVLQRIFRWAR